MKFDTMFTAIKSVMIAAWLLSFTPPSFAIIDDDAPHPVNPPQKTGGEELADINIYEEYCSFGDVFRTDCSSIINAAIEKIPAPMRDDVLRDFAPFCHKGMRPEKRVELLENLAKLSPSKREMFTQLFRTHLHNKRKFLASETLLSLSNVSEENMEDIIKRVAKAHQNCKYFLKFLIESWSELPTPEARDDVDTFLATTKIEGLRSQYYKLAIAMEAPPEKRKELCQDLDVCEENNNRAYYNLEGRTVQTPMIARRVARLLLNQTSRNHRLSLLENLNHLDGFYSYPEGGDLFKEFVSLSPEHQLPVLKRIVSLYEQERLSWGQKQEQATRTKTIQGVKCDFRICAREKPEIQLDPLVKVLAQFSENEFQRALPHVIQWHTEFSLIRNGICETEGMSFISKEYGTQTLYLQNAAPRFARVFEELRKTNSSEWPKKCQDLAPADFSLKTGD